MGFFSISLEFENVEVEANLCVGERIHFWESHPSPHRPLILLFKCYCPERTHTVKSVFLGFMTYHLSDPADRKKIALTLALINTEKHLT